MADLSPSTTGTGNAANGNAANGSASSGSASSGSAANGGAVRRARTKGGLVTILTVSSLVAGIGLTWLGLGANDHVSANFDASSWMWSTIQGELARVNGLTAKVDTRHALPDNKGHQIQLSQSDRYLILRDLSTGTVNAFDPATLAITSTLDTQQGLGITIALHNDAAFIVDAAQGVVRQLDPATLQPIGEALRFPPGITGGAFDGKGRLWIAVPSEGTVTAITPARGPALQGQGGQGGAGSGPALVRTDPVAEPWHDLTLSALDDGVAVLDQTNGKLVTLRGDATTTVTTDAAGGELPSRSTGDTVPVTVAESRRIYVISGNGNNNAKVSDFVVPGEGPLQPAVSWAGRIYAADVATGKVYALDRNGRLVGTITFKVPGPLQLEVRENHLFINSPGSSTAYVINEKHQDREVDKFRNEIVGGDPPVLPPPDKPLVTKPGAPRNIRAVGGDNQVTLTWGKAADNGSRIIKYIVSGNGQTWEVGANQRSLVITGLINGTEYVFNVRAVNGQGAGPDGRSNRVMPTRDVPDPPTDVQATAMPDGTVEITWTAANGQGRRIEHYEVTAVAAGGRAPIGSNNGENRIVIPDGELEYGTQVAFSIVTVNDIGGASVASTPLSNSVVPFNLPGAPRIRRAGAAADVQGGIDIDWDPAAENGRPITGYEVTIGDEVHTVDGDAIGAVISGFADGEMVAFEVVAINEAGPGPAVQGSAQTMIAPTVSNVNTASIGFNSMVVRFAHTDGGGAATCTLTINGGATNIPCSSGAGGYTVGGLWPDQTYNYTVTVRNAAGQEQSPQVGAQTPALHGTVTCINTNQYGDPTYCNDGLGVYINTRQQTGEAVGDAFNGQRYQVFCKRQGTAGNQSGDATLDAVAYNGHKRSSMWIQIEFRGNRRYIPWIWINLDSGDNYNMLNNC